MRHQRAGRKLGRTTSHRQAMFKNMLASFFSWEKIETTTAKAKELRPLAEKMITLGKKGDLSARRAVLRLIPDKKIVQKLFNEIAPKFKSRLGGYTRIVKTGFRAGDSAPMSIIEIISELKDTEKKKGVKKKKATIQPKKETKKEGGKVKASDKETQGQETRVEKKESVEAAPVSENPQAAPAAEEQEQAEKATEKE